MNENNTNSNVSPKELYDLKKQDKERIKKKDQVIEKVNKAPKKIAKYVIFVLILIAIIGGLVWLTSRTPNLPPTSHENHSEDSPVSHILTSPIPDRIQRHMLEHADGDDSKSSGIIIQYNCDDYSCEYDLVQKLTTLVEEYPDNVYLAPNNYDGKIILTGLGRIEILDEFDEQTIRNFIR